MKDTGLQTLDSDDCSKFYKAKENIGNLNHIVDDLSQGKITKTMKENPEEKDIS